MKYYHVRISIKDKGEFYRNDETNLGTIIKEVVKPYLDKTEFFFSNTMVGPFCVNEIKIVETNAKSSAY